MLQVIASAGGDDTAPLSAGVRVDADSDKKQGDEGDKKNDGNDDDDGNDTDDVAPVDGPCPTAPAACR